ncbi:quinone oxidoreductase [Paramyrothecium foliicola]|nr:quinone oxidoreductase [Paramyrothecium foliicola]
MKSAFHDKSLRVEVRDIPKPVPAAGQILIKTIVAGLNPKDWKLPFYWAPDAPPANHGDDIAGYVEAVGEGVLGFHQGDRVAAFHQIMAPHGSFAEFSIAWARSTFHIPAHTSFEEAATIPLPAMTAAVSLYQKLHLPLPWQSNTDRLPLIIWGGASTVGAYAIKLAVQSNIHPIIAIAGSGCDFTRSLLDESKGDVVLDYRKGQDYLVQEIHKAADDVSIAFDAVSDKGSVTTIAKVYTDGGKIATVLSPEMAVGSREVAKNAEILLTNVGAVHEEPPQGIRSADREFGTVFFPYFGVGLAEGWFRGHPHEVVDGGLDGLEQAIKRLQGGKISAKRLVLRIGDTEGVTQT